MVDAFGVLAVCATIRPGVKKNYSDLNIQYYIVHLIFINSSAERMYIFKERIKADVRL